MSSVYVELSSKEEINAKIIESFAQYFLTQKDSDDLITNKEELEEF
jgi:hypothetical protein